MEEPPNQPPDRTPEPEPDEDLGEDHREGAPGYDLDEQQAIEELQRRRAKEQ
ncbi:MAG TPA: hypothetical protein VFR97_13520 [Capillimicrobium sp.]|nr:hypothetical protein [Capillimicrobium sp.]